MSEPIWTAHFFVFVDYLRYDLLSAPGLFPSPYGHYGLRLAAHDVLLWQWSILHIADSFGR